MKAIIYNSPEIEIVDTIPGDVITTSPGTETTPKDECDGVWDLDFGAAKRRMRRVIKQKESRRWRAIATQSDGFLHQRKNNLISWHSKCRTITKT